MNDLGLQMKNKSGKIRNTPTTKLVAKVGIPDNIVTSLYQIDALAFPRCASKEERTLVFKPKTCHPLSFDQVALKTGQHDNCSNRSGRRKVGQRITRSATRKSR
jgi:hypothetical protein